MKEMSERDRTRIIFLWDPQKYLAVELEIWQQFVYVV